MKLWHFLTHNEDGSPLLGDLTGSRAARSRWRRTTKLANREMLPATLNRAKSDKVGERQLDLAKKFRAAGLISEATLANIQAKFVPIGTGKYELQEP